MNTRLLERLIGPRIPDQGAGATGARYLVPTLLMCLAGLLLLISIFTPYWTMTLHAPQYPKGLTIRAYLNRLEGDVREIDGLNHYIGMRPLGEAAQLERSLSIMAVAVLALLVLAAVYIHNRWAAFLALPAVLFPVGFLADLLFWLHNFGHSLDPKAALSSAIKPFTPPVLGEGMIGQFRTIAVPDTGLILASIASFLVLAGLWFHRRAYKPLVDEMAQSTARLLILCVLSLGLAARTGAVAGFDLQDEILRAGPGETIEVPEGVHRGPIVIDKTLTLLGRPGAVLSGGGRGDVVRITAPGVTLRGFTIRETGSSLDQENAGVAVRADDVTVEANRFEDVLFGIKLNGAHRCTIRDNVIGGKALDISWRGDGIRLWNSHGAQIEGNTIASGRDLVVWYSQDARLERNRVTDSRYGIHFMYCDGSVVLDNILEGNSVGAFLMYSKDMTVRGNRLAYNRGPSGYGLGLKDMDGLVAQDNRIVGNRVGVFLDNSPSSMDASGVIRGNLIAHNDIGLAFQPAVKRNRVSGNAFIENGEHVAVLGGGAFEGNDFSVEGRGNFWSDYAGYDLDGDGIGDLPYRSESLFENLMDRDPKLRLLQFSPAQQAIEIAARAFPTFKPRPKLIDAAPLVHPVVPFDLPSEATPRWPMAALCGALLSVLGGVMVVARRSEIVDWSAPATAVREDGHPAAMLELNGVTKRYGRFTALDQASLQLGRGEAVALWGANGAGKTTLIKCVLGLLRFEGRVVVAGADLARSPKEARRALGYVPQELAFYGDWSASELLAFLARLKRVGPDRVDAVFEEVGLSEHRSKRIDALSGGMKQRLALAAALLADPAILVLDEITSSLDADGRRALLRLLDAQKRAGKTILFSSHRLDEVEALAARVVTMERGRIVKDGTPEGLAESLGARTRLSIPLHPGSIDRAAEVLLARGWASRRNGTGLELGVARGTRAVPIRILVEAGIDVTDFALDEEEST